MLPQLNLPPFDVKISQVGNDAFIHDLIRNKPVLLTPEEWVRQHFVNFLISEKKYPKGLISVEKSSGNADVMNRTDIVIYNKFGNPWMIIECKANDVAINNDTFYQALRYHMNLKVLYIVVTNGMEHYCVSLGENDFVFMDDLPEFEKT